MPDPSSALWNALDSSTPLVIVYYADETRREELIKEVRSLYPPDQEVHCSDNVEDAFRVPHVLLLTPCIRFHCCSIRREVKTGRGGSLCFMVHIIYEHKLN